MIGLWTSASAYMVAPATLPRRAQVPARCAAPLAAEDPYTVLGVERGASAAKIKQAYRRLAMRSHPDVNKAPDAEEQFTRIAEAYATLTDQKAKGKYDRSADGRRGARKEAGGGGSAWEGWNPADPFNTASSNDPAARAAAEERRRRWEEENPTPDQLGDSFGDLLKDVVSGIGSVVSGSGDFISFLDELQLPDTSFNTLMRSGSTAELEEELDSARWVQTTLNGRIDRLQSEAKAAEDEASNLRREAAAPGGAGGMAKQLERELQRDLQRRRQRVADAKRLLVQARAREQKLTDRIEELRRGGGGGRSGPPKRIASVEDELAAMKRAMNPGAPAPPPPPRASAPPPAAPPPSAVGTVEPIKMKAGAIKAELRELGVDPSGLLEKPQLVEALIRARARERAKSK